MFTDRHTEDGQQAIRKAKVQLCNFVSLRGIASTYEQFELQIVMLYQ